MNLISRVVIAGGLVGAGAAAKDHSRAATARVDGRGRPPEAVPAVRLGATAVGHLEGGHVGGDRLAGSDVGLGHHEAAARAVALERGLVRYFWAT